MKIIIDTPFDIPGSTPQQRKTGGGKSTHPTPGLRYARAAWRALVEPYRPAKPMAGAVGLYVRLKYHTNDKRRVGRYKTTKPDGVNLLKLLEDEMTKAGYWKDDNQLADERIQRMWVSGESYAEIIAEELEA